MSGSGRCLTTMSNGAQRGSTCPGGKKSATRRGRRDRQQAPRGGRGSRDRFPSDDERTRPRSDNVHYVRIARGPGSPSARIRSPRPADAHRWVPQLPCAGGSVGPRSPTRMRWQVSGSPSSDAHALAGPARGRARAGSLLRCRFPAEGVDGRGCVWRHPGERALPEVRTRLLGPRNLGDGRSAPLRTE